MGQRRLRQQDSLPICRLIFFHFLWRQGVGWRSTVDLLFNTRSIFRSLLYSSVSKRIAPRKRVLHHYRVARWKQRHRNSQGLSEEASQIPRSLLRQQLSRVVLAAGEEATRRMFIALLQNIYSVLIRMPSPPAGLPCGRGGLKSKVCRKVKDLDTVLRGFFRGE